MHGAAWVTVNVWPAMVSVPVRAAPVLAATLNATVPGPLPLAPLVTVIQLALDVADQLQLAPALTPTLLATPAAATAKLFDAIAYVHGAAWVTVNVWPAMVSVPVRAAPVLAATLNATVPGPLPLAPLVTVIQLRARRRRPAAARAGADADAARHAGRGDRQAVRRDRIRARRRLGDGKCLARDGQRPGARRPRVGRHAERHRAGPAAARAARHRDPARRC